MKQSKKKVILKLIIKHLLKNSLMKLKKNNFDYLLNIKLFLAFKLKNKKEEKIKTKIIKSTKNKSTKNKVRKINRKKNIYAIWYLLFKLKNLTNVKKRKNE